MVLYAHVARLADTTLFDRLPGTAAPIAAGPGWNTTELPDTIAHVNNLATATVAVSQRRTAASRRA